MRIAVASRKGGTGKTVVTVALATLIPCSLQPEAVSQRPCYGMPCAEINPDLCIECLSCVDGGGPVRCEGWAVCTVVCPAGTTAMKRRYAGAICYSKIALGPFSHARLEPGFGTSGLLVTEVKEQAFERAGDRQVLLIDGPPGAGCPLISTVTGTDVALVVTEPSASALHDLKRVATVCRGFGVTVLAVINKCDLEEGMADATRRSCRDAGIRIVGEIPFDETVIQSIRELRPVTAYDCPAARAIRTVWKNIGRELGVA